MESTTPAVVESVAVCATAQSVPRIDPAQPEVFVAWLRVQLNKPICLTFTRNRSTLLSCRERRGVLRVRMHQTFAAAGAREVVAIARYLTGSDREASAIISDFIATHGAGEAPAEGALAPRGRFHDLDEIHGELNERFFHGASNSRITWGHAGSRRSRRTIQLGSFVANENLIRIHPSLDQAFVPRQYVAWVVFHEMLHEVLGVERKRRRRSVHPPEFGVLEATFPDFAACKEWERLNLHRLLRFRKS
jgi:hypothetical protein